MQTVKTIVLGSAKAISAFVVAYIIAQVAKKGLNIDAATQATVSSAVEALIVAVVVWIIPNRK